LGEVTALTQPVHAACGKELIAWLKANPDKAWQGTGGHLEQVAGVFLQKVTGTRFGFVPYRGVSQAMQDLVGGQIDLMLASAPVSLPATRAGNIKAHAVTAKTRLAISSDIPTTDEAGLPGFHFSSWQALWARPRARGRM
jgi:tripartite-type tricarboxylate transporter receptor subunit TctC